MPRGAFTLRTLWPTLAIGAIATTSAVIRVTPLLESLWIDELHTAWCALAKLDEVSQRAAIGNQSPLFFWLEWVIIRTVGASEFAVRLPSFIAGSLLPIVVYVLGRRWSSAAVGLLAAAMIAVDPLAIFYASEARPYALVQLLAVIHVALTGELLAKPTLRRRVTWIIVAAALFHLHYTAGLLLVAEAASYCLAQMFCPKDVTYGWRSAVIDVIITGILLLPAANTLSTIFSRRDNWADFVPQSDLWQALLWWPALAAAFYLLAAAFTGRKLTVSVLLAICWATVPLAIAWLATATDVARLYYPRYLLIVPPAAALLAAWCIEVAPWQWSKWLLAALLMTASAAIGGVPQRLVISGIPIEPRNEDWRGTIAWLNEQHATRPFPVLVASGLIEAKQATASPDELMRDYLALPATSLYLLDVHRDEIAPLVVSPTGRLDQTIEMLILHRGGAWLVVRGNKESARRLATDIAAQFRSLQPPEDESSWRISQNWSGGNVHVIAIEAAQP